MLSNFFLIIQHQCRFIDDSWGFLRGYERQNPSRCVDQPAELSRSGKSRPTWRCRASRVEWRPVCVHCIRARRPAAGSRRVSAAASRPRISRPAADAAKPETEQFDASAGGRGASAARLPARGASRTVSVVRGPPTFTSRRAWIAAAVPRARVVGRMPSARCRERIRVR